VSHTRCGKLGTAARVVVEGDRWPGSVILDGEMLIRPRSEPPPVSGSEAIDRWCSRGAVDALRLKSHDRLPGHFTVAVETGLIGM